LRFEVLPINTTHYCAVTHQLHASVGAKALSHRIVMLMPKHNPLPSSQRLPGTAHAVVLRRSRPSECLIYIVGRILFFGLLPSRSRSSARRPNQARPLRSDTIPSSPNNTSPRRRRGRGSSILALRTLAALSGNTIRRNTTSCPNSADASPASLDRARNRRQANIRSPTGRFNQKTCPPWRRSRQWVCIGLSFFHYGIIWIAAVVH
jgi:hypothetical protein